MRDRFRNVYRRLGSARQLASYTELGRHVARLGVQYARGVFLESEKAMLERQRVNTVMSESAAELSIKAFKSAP